MGDPQYPYPVALHWTDDPESLKKLKNKLLLYFQKKSESNGGECEIRDTNCSRGYILIHFKEEAARDRVLHKDLHVLKVSRGMKMRLDVGSVRTDNDGSPEGSSVGPRTDLPPQPSADAPAQHVPQEPQTSLLLIENIQDSFKSEMLNLLLENISGKNESTDFHVERIPENQCAVITFTCDIDIMKCVETFSSHSRIQTLKMTAKLLEESRWIRVEGLLPDTPKDYITLYFESSKCGGPGSIEDILVIPEERAAHVTFTTIEAAKNVLGRKHQFAKKDVCVYPYYPSQDIVLYGKQRPQIQKPEPLTFPVSPYILEFILSDAQQKDHMEKTMGAHTCEIKWPDLLSPNPEITLNFPDTLSTHLRTLTRLVPTWNDTVHAEFSRLISRYKVVEYKMNQSVWDAIKEHTSSPKYNQVLIKPDKAAEKVFLAGVSMDIDKTDPIFRQLVEETTKQVERKNQTRTETLSMSPAFYQIMCNSGLQKILDQVPELKIDYDVSRKEIHLSGVKDEVLTAKCEILDLQIQLESKTTQEKPQLTPFLVSTNEDLFNLASGSQSGRDEDGSSEDKVTLYNEVTQESSSSLVVIEKVLDSFTPEMVNILVENISQKMEGKDFYVERIPEIQSAVVTFTCDIDIPKFIKNFTSNHRVQNQLTARPLEESCCVRVENIPENTPKMFLAAFFENPKQGGGKVEQVEMLPEEGAALITFHDRADVVRVLKKEHMFSKRKISVYPYYPALEIALYGQQGPCIETPKPIEFKISPYILQYICNNEGLKNNIVKKMADKHCEIKWPHQDCQEPVLQLIFPPALDTHLRSRAKIVPKWNEEVYNEFSRLISRFRVIEYKMDPSVWEAIREHVSGSTYDRVLIKPECGSEKVFMAGISKDITEIDPKFRQLVEETTKQVERKNQTKTETLSMSPALDYDVSRKEIHLSGVEEAKPIPKYRGRKPEMVETFFPVERVHETSLSANQMMTRENIVITVQEGLIQNVTTDVVVNSVGKHLQLSMGATSKALQDKAGNKLQQCLNSVGSRVQVTDGSVLITEGCNLPCKIVIHVVVPPWDGRNGSSEKIFRGIVSNCLCESEKQKMRSITFPAIGTGALGFPKRIAAAFMFEEILKFSSKSNSQHLREVCFIVHPSDKDTLRAFSEELSRNAAIGTPSKMAAVGPSPSSQTVTGSSAAMRSWFGRNMEVLEEPKVFQSWDAVEKKKTWLHDLIMKDQTEHVITEDWIQEFDDKDQEAVLQLQKQHQVSLVIDLPNFTVKVLGLSKDVLEVSNKIHDMIKKVRDKKTREREAELYSNLVEWGYQDGNGKLIPFDKMTNMELEKTKNEKKQSINVYINGRKYTANVELLTIRDPQGNRMKIERNSKHGKLDVPTHWDAMNKVNLKVVPLTAGSLEYADVKAEFRKSCHMRIIKIERIQNRHLWNNYQIKKQSIDEKNGSNNNEKRLFHGLDANTVNSVNHNGFNRSYAGKNSALYGNGTYFAVNANYSAHDTFSRPDGNGYQYMYLSRVVTGVSCVGRQGMIAPPAKSPSNPTDLYDSVTDNQANPTTYVIFHDIQAYPEYLITFTK